MSISCRLSTEFKVETDRPVVDFRLQSCAVARERTDRP